MAAERELIAVLLEMVSAGVDDHCAVAFLRGVSKERGESPEALASALATASASFDDVANPYLLSIVNTWINAERDGRAFSGRDVVDVDLGRWELSDTIDLTDTSVRRAARWWRKLSPR